MYPAPTLTSQHDNNSDRRHRHRESSVPTVEDSLANNIVQSYIHDSLNRFTCIREYGYDENGNLMKTMDAGYKQDYETDLESALARYYYVSLGDLLLPIRKDGICTSTFQIIILNLQTRAESMRTGIQAVTFAGVININARRTRRVRRHHYRPFGAIDISQDNCCRLWRG